MYSSYELKFETKDEAAVFLETIYSDVNLNKIAGLDECGRGPMCGPVVVACVVLPRGHGIEGIRDSKRLTEKRREELAEKIMEKGYWGIGACENEIIDQINIHQATHKAAKQSITGCLSNTSIDFLLCDGGLELEDAIDAPVKSIIKGDLWCECIGAASIIAKVYRDTQMKVYHDIWPEYGFHTNNGYGTEQHLSAIKKYGLTPIHRRTFGICQKTRDRIDTEKERKSA